MASSALFFLVAYVARMAGSNCADEPVCDQYSERYKLTKALLQNYDRFQVPSENSKKPVNVTITMWPYDILHVNEARSSIKFSGWLDLRWVDYHMQWKPEEHGNLTHLFIPASKLWLPSVDIFYKKDERHARRCDDCYIKVDSTGETLWGQYFSFTFPCTISVRHFPYDTQYCEMELANWYLDDRMMDLYPRDSVKALDLSVFLPNVEWELLNVTVTRRRGFFNYGYFSSVAYRLYIKRKPFFYVAVLVVPSLMITLTAVIGFHLPSSGSGVHEEKVQMGVTAVLSIFILQLGVADKLPPSSDVVPLIGIYYASMVMILSVSIVASALIIVIEKQGIYGQPIPDILQLIFLWRRRPNRHYQEPGRLSHDACIFGKNNCDRKRRHVTVQNELLGEEREEREEARRQEMRRNMYATLVRYEKRSFQAAVAAAKIPFNHDGCFCAFDLSQALNDTLAAIRMSVVVLEERLCEQERKQRIRRDWSALADVVERISLALFITAAFTALLMFFYHGWY